MFNEFFQDTLLPAMLTVAGVFVTALTGIAITAVQKWAEKQKNQTVALVLGEATDAVATAVAMVNQTFAHQVRLARDDGKLTREEASKAMRMALDAAKVQLGASGMASLAKIVGGDIRAGEVLTTMVEAAVYEQKPPVQSAEDFLKKG